MGLKNDLPEMIARALGVPAPVGRSNWVANGDTIEVPWHRAIGEALDVPYVSPKSHHMQLMMDRVGVEWDAVRHHGVGTGGNIMTNAYRDLYEAIRSDPLTLPRKVAFETASGYDQDQTIIDEEEGRRVLRAIRVRRGQAAFRERLLEAYASRCAVTGSNLVAVLEAAHIRPFAERGAAVVQNGLLLRADIHTLFDLLLIAIDESSHKVLIHESLRGTDYEELEGTILSRPDSTLLAPLNDALRSHRERAGL